MNRKKAAKKSDNKKRSELPSLALVLIGIGVFVAIILAVINR
ncbi:hypothetical protein OR1_00351 [Geobacter sp. OR-1]|nr:hypothetical protein [Geobacter sp. OR-1]GAM08080.1 hypothetical protein OR1_00351 [Geobacter sp. OR-1]